MKWYKRDPAAALEGMLGLSAEERGYYNTLIDLLYARAPRSDVTDVLVVKAMGERPQVWRRVKAKLIAKGKVRDTDGKLTANRVETEVKLASYRIGLVGVLNTRRLEKQRLKATDAEPRTTTTTREVKKERASHASKKAARKSARPMCEFPADWTPVDLQPAEQIEFDRFRDSARAHARKYADWPAAWRNWKRSPYQQQRAVNGQPGQTHPKSGITTAIDGLIERLEGEEKTGGVSRQTDLRMLPGRRG